MLTVEQAMEAVLPGEVLAWAVCPCCKASLAVYIKEDKEEPVDLIERTEQVE